jgi:hypothetical protein
MVLTWRKALRTLTSSMTLWWTRRLQATVTFSCHRAIHTEPKPPDPVCVVFKNKCW